ncbi:MAG: class I SAM-dependent methyltransferase [Candidatus Heimdallarchaeota archaeon]
MDFWVIFLPILGIFVIIVLILALPRMICERVPSIEAIDDPDVAKAFERMANTPPFKLLRRKVISTIKKLNPKGKLVDIGCGSGNLIIQIAESSLDLDLTGIDLSEEIISAAVKKAEKNGVKEKIKFEIGSVEKLPFPDDSIDFIVSTLSLHHWSEPLISFKEISRVLTKDGICLVFDFRRNSRKFFYGLLTFATKIVVPKPLKRINEPLGSLKAAFNTSEIVQLLTEISSIKFEIEPYLAWMFIKIEKN